MRVEKFKYNEDRDAEARARGQWKYCESNGIATAAMIEASLNNLRYRHKVKERFHELAVERGVLETWKKMENVTPYPIVQLFKSSSTLRDAYVRMIDYYNGDGEVMCFDISFLAATLGIGIKEGALALAGRISNNGIET